MPSTESRRLGDRGDLLVYFATTQYDGPAGTDRHLADQLSRYAPVLFVDPPVSVLTLRNHPDLRRLADEPKLRVLHPRLARLIPWVVPGVTRPGLHRLVAPMMRRATRAAVARLTAPAGRGTDARLAAVVSTRIDDLWSAAPARRTLFYATDDVTAGTDLLGMPRERMLRHEARTLRTAGVVAAVSPPLVRRYTDAGYPAHLVPTGCDPAAYADVDTTPPAAEVRLPGPIVGFVGHINSRIDLALLEAVAAAGHSLLLVGPRSPGYQPQRFSALLRRHNVQWVGAKPFAALPGYLRLIDVGLTPYAQSAFNQASFPLKTLEYLAAGRAVVATPLPATEWLGTDLIRVAADPAQFATQVGLALVEPRPMALVARRREFAERHSWAIRARRIADLVALPGATRDASEAPT
ncbi:hypothetical protein GCM10011608_28840 [Micromonospora sonchi]|uniref:Glycosyltransferase n=1 Tax=Micromonospora sonchi TaxID=1763543 RepID=A0A917WYQ3_9ACTN|nr:glycosyltransferase [Micromonospora sonchi]GGM42418.1 hypothetical protein GCM10011608_28840 [Micromonospora sonchi]